MVNKGSQFQFMWSIFKINFRNIQIFKTQGRNLKWRSAHLWGNFDLRLPSLSFPAGLKYFWNNGIWFLTAPFERGQQLFGTGWIWWILGGKYSKYVGDFQRHKVWYEISQRQQVNDYLGLFITSLRKYRTSCRTKTLGFQALPCGKQMGQRGHAQRGKVKSCCHVGFTLQAWAPETTETTHWLKPLIKVGWGKPWEKLRCWEVCFQRHLAAFSSSFSLVTILLILTLHSSFELGWHPSPCPGPPWHPQGPWSSLNSFLCIVTLFWRPWFGDFFEGSSIIHSC